MGFTTASAVQQQRGDLIQITTGSKELDGILDGALLLLFLLLTVVECWTALGQPPQQC